MRIVTLSGAAALAALVTACGSPDAGHAARTLSSPAAIEAHVRFLSDDLLEGRDTGTRGHQIAALYAAAQFGALGLTPAGDGGSWYQHVPLIRGQRVLEGARFTLRQGEHSTNLKMLDEYLPSINFNAEASEVTAPLVFVGQAVKAPELGHDDLAGVDLKGKIAVYFGGAPERFGDTERAVHASNREKARDLVAAGAVGTIYLSKPKDEEKRPWAKSAENWSRPGMRLKGKDGHAVDGFPQLAAGATVPVATARRLFEGAPVSFDEALARVEKGESRSFAMPASATIAVRAHFETVDSLNVVARMPGSDPALAGESVVFSAHLDHLGIGAPVDGDAIYNGASDNALGSAILLELARQMTRSAVKPKRSAVFLLVTAEEKGLLGAEYFAAFPTVPAVGIVADVNMDMPVLMTPLSDVVMFGAEHSTLAPIVERAVRAGGMTISPDPLPEETVFVRSDQYAFVRQGIPSVYLDAGIKAIDPKVDAKKLLQEFLDKHYHQPSDDVSLAIDYGTAARMADINLRIGLMVANAAERPRWNEGDFLGTRFGK